VKEIILFELRFRLRQPSTYIFAAVLFTLGLLFVSTDVIQIGGGSGRIMGNAPYVIVVAGNILTLLGAIIASSLMGTAIYRDFEANAHELFFTTRLTKRDYFIGRFLGAFIVTLAVFSFIPLGFLAGIVAPWADKTNFGPFRAESYLTYLGAFMIPNLFLLGTLFFVFGALTRSLLAIYVQGIIVLVGYLMAQGLLSSLENKNLAAYLDPLGIGATALTTRYWTLAEKNTNLLPMTGPLLYNRLLWTGITVGVFVLGYRLFEFSKFALALPKVRRSQTGQSSGPASADVAAPTLISLSSPNDFGNRRDVSAGEAFIRLTRFYFREIVRGVPFLAITLMGIMLLLVNAWQADKVFDTPVYPVTRVMMQTVAGSFGLFLLILITFYAGELTWRERTLRLDQVTDALPVPTTVSILSKVTAMLLMLLALNGVLILTGIGVQAAKGYFQFEIPLYLAYFLAYIFPNLVVLTLTAFFLHAVINNKFIGHTVLILLFISSQTLPLLKLDRHLYRFGSVPNLTYSDMNGFGPFVTQSFWFGLYWFAVSIVLLTLAVKLWVRGKDDSLVSRWRKGQMGRAVTGIAGAASLTAIGVGGFILYNTDVLNEYIPQKESLKRQADYERTYKQNWSKKPMPRIIAVKMDVDMHPEVRQYMAKGTYRLKNKTSQPIAEIALQLSDPRQTVKELKFGVSATPDIKDQKTGFRTYRLVRPMQPGEETTLDFTVGFDKKGFPNEGMEVSIAANGSFITMPGPAIGYQSQGEIAEEEERKKQGLPPRPRMPPVTDLVARGNTYIGNDADWIDFEAVVRTAPDQIAIAPGYLQEEWSENGRRCFSYKMDAPIRNFYSFLSARYAVKKDQWVGRNGNKVALEIYYHPAHAYNLDRMMAGMKAALSYCSENYTPYQFRQLRILEFPAYQQFAQSFPNTVPYSESIGFIAKVSDDAEDIDYPFYVTAHETAHQWWAHQVLGGNVEGATMLSESLAEYTALKILEKKYGPDRIRRFLRYDLDRYLRGRGGEKEGENPLVKVQNQQYIHYPKGALVFYALADRIGDEKLNAALSGFAKEKGFQQPPYTTAPELMTYLRAAAPPYEQDFLTDLFEKITVYDLRATTAESEKLANGKYRVKLTVTAAKSHADSSGKESSASLNDIFDIGVFAKLDKPARDKDALGKPLHFERVRLTEGAKTFTFDVDAEPEKAGIDPYNKLIDRIPSDNTIRVTTGSQVAAKL